MGTWKDLVESMNFHVSTSFMTVELVVGGGDQIYDVLSMFTPV